MGQFERRSYVGSLRAVFPGLFLSILSMIILITKNEGVGKYREFCFPFDKIYGLNKEFYSIFFEFQSLKT